MQQQLNYKKKWQNKIIQLGDSSSDAYIMLSNNHELNQAIDDYKKMANDEAPTTAAREAEIRKKLAELQSQELATAKSIERHAKKVEAEKQKQLKELEKERQKLERKQRAAKSQQQKDELKENLEMLDGIEDIYNNIFSQYEEIAENSENIVNNVQKVSLKRPEGYKANKPPKNVPKPSSGGSGSGSGGSALGTSSPSGSSGSGSGAAVPTASSTPDQTANNGKTEVQIANETYEMPLSYQTVTLRENKIVLDAVKEQYKYYKAAFMKMISANNDKLKEATYLDAVAECAMDEVEDYFSMA